MEELRTDRLGLLLDQLDSSRQFSQARLEGLSDEEYLWEPAPGAWSIRRREQAATPKAFGPGEWLLDRDSPDPDPAPVTTIAGGWGICIPASRVAGSGPSGSGGSRLRRWSTSPPRPRWPWSGSGR